MKYMNDCRSSGHLKFRLQRLMRIDQRLMKERRVSSLRDTSIDCLSCLCLGHVLDTDSPLKFHAVCSWKRTTHSRCRKRKYGTYIYMARTVCYIERCCLRHSCELPHVQLSDVPTAVFAQCVCVHLWALLIFIAAIKVCWRGTKSGRPGSGLDIKRDWQSRTDWNR